MKKYNGWQDIANLRSISGVPVHNITEELPPRDEVVIPIRFSPGDEPLHNTPVSQWPWDDPLLIACEGRLGGELEIVSGEGIMLWWVSTLELKAQIEKAVSMDHITMFAQSIAMQYMEENNGNQQI